MKKFFLSLGLRRSLLAAGLSALALVVTAGPALAWHGVDHGYAACVPQGVQFTFIIDTWDAQHSGFVETRLGLLPTPATFTETLPFGTTSDRLDWKMTWPDSREKDYGHETVYFDGTCSSPTPTPTPSPTVTPTPTPTPTSSPPTSTSSSPHTTPDSSHTTPPSSGGRSPHHRHTATTGLNGSLLVALGGLLALGLVSLLASSRRRVDE
jgi:hypothetical protein